MIIVRNIDPSILATLLLQSSKERLCTKELEKPQTNVMVLRRKNNPAPLRPEQEAQKSNLS